MANRLLQDQLVMQILMKQYKKEKESPGVALLCVEEGKTDARRI